MKNTWDYSEAGNKTSVKIHNAPGKWNFKVTFFLCRWQFTVQSWMGQRTAEYIQACGEVKLTIVVVVAVRSHGLDTFLLKLSQQVPESILSYAVSIRESIYLWVDSSNGRLWNAAILTATAIALLASSIPTAVRYNGLWRIAATDERTVGFRKCVQRFQQRSWCSAAYGIR